jgi:mRNA-degrading endonuclease YafQ of YafQ-DinJ toxin-antitoxin module
MGWQPRGADGTPAEGSLMRWREIEEAVQSRLREPTEGGVKIAVTKRFEKDFASFAKSFPKLRDEFELFLDTKLKNIDQSVGKKDTQWGGGAVDGISGWWHAHLFFGKAIIIYKPVGKTLVLAAVTDHLSVEGTGAKIKALGEYLKKINLSDDPSPASFKKQPHAITKLEPSVLKSELGFADDALEVDPVAEVKKQVKQFLYQMAANAIDREILRNFVDNKYPEELAIFLEFGDLPITYKAISHAEMMSLVKGVLADIPSS